MLKFHSLSLQFKLTLFFLLTGFAIGITSSFLFALESTRDLLHTFMDTELNPVSMINNSTQDSDWIFNFFKMDFPDKKAATVEKLKNTIPKAYRNSINYVFYFSPKNRSRWKILGSTCQSVQSVSSNNSELIRNIPLIKKQRLVILHQLTLHKIFLYISNPSDRYKYIVHTEIDSKKILIDTLRNRDFGLKLLLIAFLFSLIFGHILGKHITTPVRIMSDKLEQLSRGDFSVRYKTERDDAIGKMAKAMNEMAVATSYRIRTLHAMHRIDLEVISSDSRSTLLKKITIFIADQFPDIFVDILEKVQGGYRSTILSRKQDVQRKKLFKLSQLPSNFVDNCHTFFPLEGGTLNFFGNKILNCSNLKTGISIPIIQQDQFKGVLIIAMERDIIQKDIDALTLIATQIGVVLRSIEEGSEKKALYFALILSLTNSVDIKSKWTAGHSNRVADIALAIGKKLGFDSKTLETIKISALLHDIGKLGIPEDILNKPDKLTKKEYMLIQKHSAMGEKIISKVPNFEMIAHAVRSHHEHWDGGGYPDKLSKDTIPLVARIITVADVWDALTADRPYRKGFTFSKALEIMKEERETTFDPALLDIFLSIMKSVNTPG